MEHWQDYLDKLVQEMGDESPADDETISKFSKIKRESFMKKVIQENSNLSGEIRGIQVNGNEVRGIESVGWGSMAKIEVDNETGEVKKEAERFPSHQDQLFAKLYLQYLEEDFKNKPDDESIKLD